MIPSLSHSSLPSSSPADSGRLIYATTLTLYARGVPYLFLFLLLPVVCYSIYVTYEPSTSASAPGSANSYLSHPPSDRPAPLLFCSSLPPSCASTAVWSPPSTCCLIAEWR